MEPLKPLNESFTDKIIRLSMKNPFITFTLFALLIGWGVLVAPFNWQLGGMNDPVPVDAIPDIGENQQIVFTKWPGRSPKDVEDQITYPLTTALMGVPEVKTVRSFSAFGFSTVYVIFNEKADFHWSRSRILEKLSSLPSGLLPPDVKPSLGPDATALGQVFWYTLEGRDSTGNVTGGWDQEELRRVQEWIVKYGLASTEGVAEVASVGGFLREFQIDADPVKMQRHNISLSQLHKSVSNLSLDVGAGTIEINRMEYLVRGIGFVESIEEIEKTVIDVRDGIPVTIQDVATVKEGPAARRGYLDKEGTPAVGGVVVARFGENPLKVIENLKKKINEVGPGLPEKKLDDGTVSKVTIVPFYDRSGLINETLETLNIAIILEIGITILVILVMIGEPGVSMLISGILPLAVLLTFIGMKVFGVDANIVSLSGIAIAVGTIVDMAIILSENVMKHLQDPNNKQGLFQTIFQASAEVGSAIVTAVATTIVSFLPVFTMEMAEGKLFKPLAYTKSFALIASIIVTLTLMPALLLVYNKLIKRFPFLQLKGKVTIIPMVLVVLLIVSYWLPVGADRAFMLNLFFTVLIIAPLLLLFKLFIQFYGRALTFFLKRKFLIYIPALLTLYFALAIWIGFEKTLFFAPKFIKTSAPFQKMSTLVPGLGKEFMPPLDEGSFLYMPTTMTHASLAEVKEIIEMQDRAIMAIPEVEMAVGKAGRVDSPLDPAPLSMIETVITLKPEYRLNTKGKRAKFAFNKKRNEFERDENRDLIPSKSGRFYRNWRPEIRSIDDIWDEITKAAKFTGVTSAPKLQPIAARIVMLQSGMRAPMGIKVKGPNLKTIEAFGLELEKHLKEVELVNPSAVIADRIVGKPYIEIRPNRVAIARYGLSMKEVQQVIATAIGGQKAGFTVRGRERQNIVIRYAPETRGLSGDISSLEKIQLKSAKGPMISLGTVAKIDVVKGPQMIRSEDGFLTGLVLFDKKAGVAEVDAVMAAQKLLKEREKSGELKRPEGVSYTFAGSYENQVRSENRLKVVLPLALAIIFMILYMQFKRFSTTLIVFSGIGVAWSGGFIMIWLYGQEWFLNFALFGVNLRELLGMGPINLSTAIWVGFLALFGIATDDGVVICTYLTEMFHKSKPKSISEIQALTVKAASRRVRPAAMTTATTILALLPVLSSTGRGADVMIPMAIPSFGGMLFEVMTIFLSPLLFATLREGEFKKTKKNESVKVE